jgi:hypothetical protein
MSPKSINKRLVMPFIIFSFLEKNSIPTALLLEDFSSTKSSFERTRWKRHIYSLINSIQHWVLGTLHYRITSKGPTLLTSTNF